MKRISLTLALLCSALFSISIAQAQSLVGRTYYNANIMAGEINKALDELNSKMGEARTAAIAKFEDKKGRKPTAAELADIDKQLAEGKALMEAVRKGMKTALTVEFKSDTKAVMKADMDISEEAMKAAGVSWVKRKAMKAALAVAPSTESFNYRVNSNLIIFDDGNESDTLRLSTDGKYLTGKFDKKTSFKLTRTK